VNQATRVSFVIFAVLAFLCGASLFFRPVQRAIFTRVLGARRANADELVRLSEAWNVVAEAHGIPRHRFVLAVVDSDDLNAFACGGHLLVVSSYAARNLTHEELTGVLAHELSHHLGSHTVGLTFAQWMSLPIIGLARLGTTLRDISNRIDHVLRPEYASIAFVMRIATFILTAISKVFYSGLLIAHAFGNAVGRGAEYAADARAMRMGFGEQLLGALKRFMNERHVDEAHGPLAGALASHPPARLRTQRLEALLIGEVHRKSRHDKNP
jgi:Zn-dependent protease with chaperone function